MKSIVPKATLEDWKRLQCPACRKGDRSKCNAKKKNAAAVRTDPKGKDHYYCFMGCLMLQMDENARRKFIRSAFDDDGHFEKQVGQGQPSMDGWRFSVARMCWIKPRRKP